MIPKVGEYVKAPWGGGTRVVEPRPILNEDCRKSPAQGRKGFTAGELWRIPSFAPIPLPTITDGFGSRRNNSMHEMTVFNDYLYVGTRNTDFGAQLWRSLDGINFEIVK